MKLTEKTKITRLPKQARYDAETIYSIVDEALFCTISYCKDEHPFSIPTGHCRIDNHIYIHGSVGAGYMRNLAQGISACLSITLMDSLVLTKSVFNHSVNYRSVIAFAKAELVSDEKERMNALEVFTNKMIPNRWNDCRPPSESEMRKTMMLKFSLEEASAKIRAWQANDDPEDEGLPYWSGLINIEKNYSSFETTDISKAQNIEYPGYFEL